MCYIQLSTKKYLDQKFSNMRRQSEVPSGQNSNPKPKLITAAHATPIASTLASPTVKKSDPIGYQRSMENKGYF